MTAAKPTIDECIARAERDVDLAAGWLAADKDDADAQQNYQHCVAVRDFLRAHKRLTESVSEQILQNQLAEADRRAAERDAAVNVLKAEGIRPKGKSCLPYIIRAITAERQLARETARADAWVKEVRDLARELGIADEDSNGSIHDWRHVKYKLRQLAELQQDAEIGRRWRKNSSLTEWFPFTAEELARLRDRSNNLFGALLEFHNAFHNRGETTSLHEWNERMRQADERACQILPIPPIDAAIQESKK